MLKSKRSVSACSLSSCRIRAEALARAFNNRIWPCAWVPQRSSSAEAGDGISNGIDDEEEFFDASPSPVEVEDESLLFCQQHSSAATEAGRAKLYELLQQHASDDAIDVFYDVSEDAGLADANGGTCLGDDDIESEEQVGNDCDTFGGGLCGEECGCSCQPELNDGSVENVLLIYPVNQSSGDSAIDSVPVCGNSEMPIDGQKSEYSDLSPSGGSILEHDNFAEDQVEKTTEETLECTLSCCENVLEAENDSTSVEHKFSSEEHPDIENSSEHLYEEENDSTTVENRFSSEEHPDTENSSKHSLEEEIDSTAVAQGTEERREIEKSSNAEDKISEFNEEILRVCRSTEDSDLPSENVESTETTADDGENVLNIENNSSSINSEILTNSGEENNISIEITADPDSPSATSADTKVTSPTSRLHVFDEARPKISRTTSLKTGKTPPGTPSRKKIVRFADVLGLDLEDVRHIMSGDVPIIPSSAYTDLNLKDVDLPKCEPISETLEINRRDSSNWNSMPGATATNVLYPTFPIPGEQIDFMDRVRGQGICLQTVIVSDMSVQCTCRVMNYGFLKKVTARYTVNEWRSSNDIDASYVVGSSTCETDNFAFSIFLSPQNKSIQFALKYEVNGKEYWDNNRGQNYCLNYHGNYNIHHLPSSLWQHQFW